MKTLINKSLLLSFLATGLCAQTVEIETQLFQPGNTSLAPAFGWSTKTERAIPEDNKPTEPVEPSVNLDAVEVIDWLTAEHKGFAGVYDLKATDDFVLTFEGFSGSDNFEGGHRFDEAQVFFGYTGGVNFNIPRDGGVAFGTSFNGADDGEASLRILVDVDDRRLFVYHWWNFGYGTFENLVATLRSSDGTELASATYAFNTTDGESLGLDIEPGAQYYSVNFTSIIEVQGSADGDYLELQNIGTNVGWRGTAVATGRFDVDTPFEPGWVLDPRLGWIYAYTPELASSITMGMLFGYQQEWVFQYGHGYFYVGLGADITEGSFLWGLDYGWVYVVAENGGYFQYAPYGPTDWASFLIPPGA